MRTCAILMLSWCVIICASESGMCECLMNKARSIKSVLVLGHKKIKCAYIYNAQDGVNPIQHC